MNISQFNDNEARSLNTSISTVRSRCKIYLAPEWLYLVSFICLNVKSRLSLQLTAITFYQSNWKIPVYLNYPDKTELTINLAAFRINTAFYKGTYENKINLSKVSLPPH